MRGAHLHENIESIRHGWFEMNPHTGKRVYRVSEQLLEKTLSSLEHTISETLHSQHWAPTHIEYEYELENERRVLVTLENYAVGHWKNHVLDTYDTTGRFRVRLKNNEPRLTLKIPLFTPLTEIGKLCIRLEFKPHTDTQRQEILKIRELLINEVGSQSYEKFGTPIQLTNGQSTWLNWSPQHNEYWIDIDTQNSANLAFLPPGIYPQNDTTSSVRLDSETQHFLDQRDIFIANIQVTSRTSRTGNVEHSVAADKEHLLVQQNQHERTQHIARNTHNVFRELWTHRHTKFRSPQELMQFIFRVAALTNEACVHPPDKLRTWEIPYGRKVLAQDVPAELDAFITTLFTLSHSAPTRSAKTLQTLAAWIELEIDKHIHPFADGCGRVSKAISSWFLLHNDQPLPHIPSREQYYAAMNNSDAAFFHFYSQCMGASR